MMRILRWAVRAGTVLGLLLGAAPVTSPATGAPVAAVSEPVAIGTALVRISYTAAFGPIRGFPGTGSMLGVGASFAPSVRIIPVHNGKPAPALTTIAFSLPQGTKLHTVGIPTCAPGDATEPAGALPAPLAGVCPRAAAAGAGEVRFAEEPSRLAPLNAAYAPGGGIDLYGAALEPLARGTFAVVPGSEPGPALTFALSASAPGAEPNPLSEARSLSLILGRAIRSAGRARYYLTTPLKCPLKGLRSSVALTFAGSEGFGPTTVSVAGNMACPRPRPGPAVPPSPPPPPPCTSGREITIHIVPPPHRRYVSVKVTLDGTPVPVRRHGRISSAVIDLRGKLQGTYTARIEARERSGRKVVSTRSYRTCTAGS